MRYAALIKNGVELPPVDVALMDGVLYLVDGFHRVRALKEAGRCRVKAVVKPMTWPEAVKMAVQANTKHGIPLKKKDIRRAFRMFIKAGLHKKRVGIGKGRIVLMSYREVTEHAVGNAVAHGTVRNWIKRDFPSLFEQMGRPDEERYIKGGLMTRRGTNLLDLVNERINEAEKLLDLLEAGDAEEAEKHIQKLRERTKELAKTPF